MLVVAEKCILKISTFHNLCAKHSSDDIVGFPMVEFSEPIKHAQSLNLSEKFKMITFGGAWFSHWIT